MSCGEEVTTTYLAAVRSLFRIEGLVETPAGFYRNL
jgi:hypothetical protein